MNLPADKARLLKSYDDERKWDLVCDKVRPVYSPSPDFLNGDCISLNVIIVKLKYGARDLW